MGDGMNDAMTAGRVHRAGHWPGVAPDRAILDYEGRFMRRKRLALASGGSVLVDLPETVSLAAGDALETVDGRLIEIVAAPEPLLRVTGDLTRLAWHIGNRHTPCQIATDHLLIRADHVLAAMLTQLGAGVEAVTAPFTPEGGAYGHGRTHGHDHGPATTAAGNAAAHAYGHHDHASQSHSHSQKPGDA